MIRFRKDDGSAYPDWEKKTILKLANIIDGDRGKNYPQSHEFYDSGFCLFLNAKNVTTSGLKFEENMFISQEKDSLLRNGKLQREDLVITSRGTIGNIGYYSPSVPYENMRINSGMLIMRPNEKIKPNYMYISLKTPYFTKQVKTITSGNAQPQLTLANFSKLYLNLPCLEEQQKIADFLSSVDEVIAESENEVANLEAQKKGAMQKIFSQEVRFKADDGSDYPEWEEKSVGELTVFHKQGYYTKENYLAQGIRLARVSDLYNPRVNYADMPMIDMSDKDFNAFKVEKGDFLIARSGSIGRYGIVYEIPEDEKVVFGSFVIKFVFNNKMLNTEYFGQFYNSDFSLRQLHKITQAGANININAENIKTIIVPLPCLEEQKKIAGFLSDFDIAIEEAKKELESWKQIKKGLLQQMFV